MSSFVVSARKYRPLRFDDVVGQEHVGKTLKNAIRQDTLAHAFLFCGPRGVGKTTCARILAKVLNCENVTPDTEPCGKCESCKSFERNASMNILELDGASNNGVEHIRSLIEQVRFQPQEGTYKVFIIDEVHMLSTAAFNAFLKTLEEPPSYAIFILATTEKHKILPTILSRCQIFDFKRIQSQDIVNQLQEICNKEGITAESEALHIIADKADGALRDALSIFDKVASFGGNKITYQDVINNLNVLDYDYFFRVVDALLLGDLPAILNLFNEIQYKGFDGDVFVNGLSEHLRNLLVCRHKALHHLLNLSEQLNARYMDQAAKVPEDLLMGALDLANECDIQYKMAKNKRLHVELALIKMNYLQYMEEQGANEVNPTLPAQQINNPKQSAKVSGTQRPQGPPPVSGAETSKDEGMIRNASQQLPKSVANDPSLKVQQKDESDLPEARSDDPDEGVSGEAVSFNIKANTRLEAPALGSLSNFIKQAEETSLALNELKSTVVALDQVESIWQSYAEEQQSQTVKAVLQKTQLDVRNNGIVATVASMISKSVILQENALIDRLRAELGLPRLTIKIEIDESAREDIQKPRIMTAKEKFELLCKQNPNFEAFRDDFGLTLEQDF